MGPRTDIYSLGLLLYEMVTGSQAFTGETTIAVALKQIRDAPKRPSEIVPSLPLQLEAVVLKCLRKNSESRFRSVSELDAALKKCERNNADDLRGAAFRTHPLVHSGIQKGHAAFSYLISFAGEVQRASLDLKRIVSPRYQELAPLRRAWELRTRERIRSAQAAAILCVIFVSATVVFGLATSHKIHHEQTATEATDRLSLPSPESSTLKEPSLNGVPSPDLVPAADTREVTNRGDVDLNLNADHAPDDASLSSGVTPTNDTLESRPTLVEPLENPKEQARILPPLPAKTSPAIRKIRVPLFASTSAQSATRETADIANEQTVAGSTPSLTTVSIGTAVSNQLKTEESEPASTGIYLEVGSFKDAKWADDAADRLTQLQAAVGINKNQVREIVQIAGDGFRVKIGTLQSVLQSAPELQRFLTRYAVVQGMQVAQTAACNRLHNIEQRLSRWLLITQDRVDSSRLAITHDFLATMLGTDRPTVSLAAGILQNKQIIEYTRGEVQILSRTKLEDCTCECYGVIQQYNREIGLK